MISRIFIESPDLRLGAGDHRHARRRRLDPQPADRAISRRRAAQVSIRATFPGANAQTLQNSVTQVIEQQLTGIDGLLYFSSSSSSRGQVTITATFEKGTDPDIAQVQVQNQVQQGVARLPQQVQQQGLVVRKSNPDNLLIVGVYDETDQRTKHGRVRLSRLQSAGPARRVQGVGDVNVFGSQYAMRIWLDPARLASYSLIPSDVTTAIQNQNTEVAAGEIGGLPSSSEQMLNATVTAQSRLQTPEQFRQIIVKTLPTGATVRLSDVARIELGAESYASVSRINRHPGAGIAVLLAPAPTRWRPPNWSRRRWRASPRPSRPASRSLMPTTPPPSSSCRSKRWSRR